jgi:hypothetical protein
MFQCPIWMPECRRNDVLNRAASPIGESHLCLCVLSARARAPADNPGCCGNDVACMSLDSEYSSKIKHLHEVVKIYDDVPTFLESIRDVPRSVLRLYAAHFCLSKVHNGGFLRSARNAPFGVAATSPRSTSAKRINGGSFPFKRPIHRRRDFRKSVTLAGLFRVTGNAVWSAAVLQAKSEDSGWVCANVSGL